ncbi:unnamed protein product, partial [Brassica rapa subsp. trilocularis]
IDLPNCVACNFTNNGLCTPGNGNACVMAPCFPSTEPDKFDRVHIIFGLENVYKILKANARIHDPIHGYLGPQMVYNNILNNLKREIDSAINELLITMAINLSIPSDFTEPSLFVLINEMLELNEDQKNQLRGLPDMDARRNVDEIVGMRENDQGDAHRADGASTSSGPSSGPPNQNQP